MDEKVIIQIGGLIIGGLGTIMLGLIAWGMKKLISTLFENTIAIKALETTVHRLTDDVKPIPKLQQDINAFHQWKREMQGEET